MRLYSINYTAYHVYPHMQNAHMHCGTSCPDEESLAKRNHNIVQVFIFRIQIYSIRKLCDKILQYTYHFRVVGVGLKYYDRLHVFMPATSNLTPIPYPKCFSYLMQRLSPRQLKCISRQISLYNFPLESTLHPSRGGVQSRTSNHGNTAEDLEIREIAAISGNKCSADWASSQAAH